ncbi:hypothetical protein ADL19_19715 [Streptomyces purpurogeneiscleroticus]|nr:hypothetical protein ADL19_19715 [Streptomyces purpurogeneiscleroticus]
MSLFLLEEAGSPFSWGVSDCWLLAADWCRARRGVDPAARVRGRYRTALGAARLARRLGGLEAMARADMGRCGLAETSDPHPGDVGLVMDPAAGPLFAVRSALGWMARGRRGLALVSFPVIVAWKV